MMELIIDIFGWLFILTGCFFAIIGALGLLRLPDVYTRIHSAGVVDTVAAFFMLVGFSFYAGFTLVTVKLLLILVFIGFSAARQLSMAAEGQIDLLRRRAGAATDPEVRRTIERNIERKRQLVREHRRLSRLSELLLLRLDNMGDAIELCYGKVLQLTSSPAWGTDPATTQVTVFVDALLVKVEELGSSVRDLEATLKG